MLVSINSNTSDYLLDLLLELQFSYEYEIVNLSMGGLKSNILLDFFGDQLSYQRFVTVIKDSQDFLVTVTKLGNYEFNKSNELQCYSTEFEAKDEHESRRLLDLLSMLKANCEYLVCNYKCSGQYSVQFYLKGKHQFSNFHKELMAKISNNWANLTYQSMSSHIV